MSINITTADIDAEFRKASSIDASTMSRYVDTIKEQRIIEDNWLNKYTSCSSPASSSVVLEHLATLEPQKLKAQVGNQFYNAPLMAAAACIAESFTIADVYGQLASNNRIKEYITKLKQIGNPSAFGYALKTTLVNPGTESTSDFYIIKAPRSIEYENQLYHECAIAFFGTNILRSIVPNFAYIYAKFKCSPPIIGTETQNQKDVLAWCNSVTNNVVAYAVYENIQPAISVSQYCETCNVEQYISLLVQVLYALKIAHREIDFTHYDLHHENVLVRTIPGKSSFLIPYDNVYVQAVGVATIIDFGMSHIAVRVDRQNIVHLGDADIPPHISQGTYRDRSNITSDVYKFLGFTLNQLKERNPSVYSKVKHLISFFNQKESPDEILVKQRPYIYMSFDTQETRKFGIDEFITFCRKVYDPVVTTPNPKDYILQCTSMCRTFKDSLVEAGVDLNSPPPIPDTLFEFYDVFSLLSSQAEKDPRVRERPKAFSKAFAKGFTTGTSNLNKAVNTEVANMKSYISQLKPFTYYDPPEYGLINDQALMDIKISTERVAYFLEIYKRFELSLRMLYYVITIYKLQDTEITKIFNEYHKKFSLYKSTYDQVEAKIKEGLEKFNPQQKSPQYVQFYNHIRNNERYNWIFTVFVVLSSML